MGFKVLDRFFPKFRHLIKPQFKGHASGKMIGKQHDIPRAHPQRRDINHLKRETVQKILFEYTLPCHGRQIHIGSGNTQPRIMRHRFPDKHLKLRVIKAFDPTVVHLAGIDGAQATTDMVETQFRLVALNIH